MSLQHEIAAAAARLIVDEGMEYGPAKRKAAQSLGVRPRQLPDNDEIEEAVREHLAVFHAETQPAELAALRGVALEWMQRLAEFRPHLAGAVWRGTATRLSAVHLQLFCDDPKSAEIAMLNRGIDFDVAQAVGGRGEPVDVLVFATRCDLLGEPVTVRLTILDLDDLRGALKADSRGRTACGDLRALQRLMEALP